MGTDNTFAGATRHKPSPALKFMRRGRASFFLIWSPYET